MRYILFSIGSLHIYSYGLMIAIGVICAFFISDKRANKYGLDSDVVFRLGMMALVCGMLGAKLLYVIINFKSIIETGDIKGAITEGFVVYGGIIGGVVGCYIYCKVKKYSLSEYFDLIIPTVALAQGFGRIGCFLAGCCYGEETTHAFSVTFKSSPYAPNGVKLIPTQLISSVADFINFGILILVAAKLRKKNKKGLVTSIYLINYSIGRFIIEFFRGDIERGNVGVLSTSQFIAIFILAGGIALLVYALRHNKKEEAALN